MKRIILFSFILAATTTFAQRSAKEFWMKKGDLDFANNNFLSSAKAYEQVFEKDSADFLLKIRIAESYRLANLAEHAATWYAKALADGRNRLEPVQRLNYVRVLLSLGYVEKAKEFLKSHLADEGSDPLGEAQLKALE